MARLVADALVARLRAWGVTDVFGYSGDGIDPLLAAVARAGGPRFTQARHEEGAALMACGYAKYTGRLGCCVATHGPGAIHLLNGLYDAKLDKKPVLAVIGQQHRSVLGSGYQQEIDAHVLFKDVCGAFLQTVTVPEQLELVVDRAIRAALAQRAPAGVILPHDVQRAELPDELPHAHGIVRSAVGHRPPRVLPPDDALDEAAAVLDAGERVAVLIGQGAAGAAEEVLAVADRLGAGVAKALLGKPVLSDHLPHVTGLVGHLGTTASHHLMTRCDTLLMVGTNEPYTEFLPAPGQARAVQVDLDGRNVGNRYPTEVNLVGDAAETLRALLPRLAPHGGAWRAEVEAEVARWWGILDERASAPAEPLNPQLVVRELSGRLPAGARLAVDVGSVTYWYARHLRLDGSTPAHLSSTLASMGSALPYAVAAKVADPDRPVVALVGDGAMQMNGINELVTVAHLWRRWADPRLVVLVLANGDLNEVSWEMREMEGDPPFPASQRLPAFPYAAYAELLGLRARRVDRADDVTAAWEDVLAADRPVLLEAAVDPATPLLPPHLEDASRRRLDTALADEQGPLAERARRALDRELATQGADAVGQGP